MQHLMNAGETVTKDFGPTPDRVILQVVITRDPQGVSFTVTDHPVLNRAYTNLEQSRTYLRLLRDMANAGEQTWKIEAAAGEHTSAQAVVNDAERALIDQTNATMDATHAEYAASKTTERDTAADVMAAGTWSRFRHSGTTTAAPPSDPMDRILRAAATGDGWIPRGGHADQGEADSRQLIALKRRELVELVYGVRDNRRVITGGQLTRAGYKRAGVEPSGVAA
jgi:hypothetical protein